MNNHIISINNETFFGKDSEININNTKISDTSREFRELDKEIYKTIQDKQELSSLSNSKCEGNLSIGVLLDETWVKKSSPDTSENFQIRLDEIKKKNKQVVNKHNFITINNPQKQIININNSSKFLINKKINKIEKNEENFFEDGFANSQINKISIYPVKNNNLTEINNNFTPEKNISSSLYYLKEDECNVDEGFKDNNINFLTNNIIKPKFLDKNNISTRLSTMESNESFESSNKFNIPYEDRFHTPNKNFFAHQKVNYSRNVINTYGMYTGISEENKIYHTSNIYPSKIYFPGGYDFSPYGNLENAFTLNLDNRQEKKKIKKSREELDQTLFVIKIENILYGIDKRTTIMIRHIPNKYSTQSMLEEINVLFKGKYDFFYLPMDFENQCNLGYAFINFIDSLHILQFYEAFKSRKWKKYKSHKECDLSYAKFQGKLELTSHLEKTCIMNKMGEDKKPIIINPPDPLPKIDIPYKHCEIFKSLYPNILSKVNLLKT